MARILLSEANADVRYLLEAVLQGSGHETVVVPRSDGTLPEGDVLVAEPAYGGLERARSLRRREPGLPIVLVSILPPTKACLELDPVAYLLKPFALAELELAVAKALRNEDRSPACDCR